MGNRTNTWIGLLSVVGVSAIVIAWNFPGPDAENTAAVPIGTPEPKAQPPKLPPEQESLARAATEPFAEAEAIRSGDGLLRATLTVQYGDNVIRGSHAHLRSYNGRLVGPTLRAKPGDVLKIRVENRLPQVSERPEHLVNLPHGLNSTNIHTHGLHV